MTFPDACASPAPAAVAGGGPATTVRCGPAGSPPTITLTVPPGSVAALITGPQADWRPVAATVVRASAVETIAGVDILERETAGTAAASVNGAQHAYFVCGQVWFNITGNDVLAFVRTLLPTLGC